MSEDALVQLTNEIKACVACQLKENRTQVVPGVYGQSNGICFVGEAPGYYEDQKGLPFVGRSGKLLDNMLEGIGLERDDVSILNVIKCRPTTNERGNRTPTESELRFCGDRWLFKQLKLLNPRLIVTLGGIALKFFIPKAKVTKYVGKQHNTNYGLGIFVTYHPAYILRNYNIMETYNEHFEEIKKTLNSTTNETTHIHNTQSKSKSKQKSLSDFFKSD
ncbi:MAG: uracil-DNA glycosylase [Candidatus Heimdallarchaeota archaeon]|nr:uracil-DNA glycosylase [Candidatus Heimdallarchaeota archaeon]MCK4954430.1 uracil-DNA glycosylase [Candidatus Heimdallarchaeota archaeon]